jgi:hypothetical protein
VETEIPYHELEDDPFCEAEFRRRNLSILSLKIGIKTVDRAQASGISRLTQLIRALAH